MVGLPSVESREMILRTLLAKEKVESLDYKELATMTEGYSGSDLKVCLLVDKFATKSLLTLISLLNLTFWNRICV